MEEELSPEGASKPLSIDDVLELSVDELRQQLDIHGIDTKALNKIQMQKLLIKFISMPVVSKEELKLKSKALELKMQKELEDRKEERNLELRKLEIIEEKEKYKVAEKIKFAAEKAKFDAEQAKITADAEKEQAKITADAAKEQAKITADAEIEKV